MILFKGIKFKKIEGITLFPFILVRPDFPKKALIRHEEIHIRQQMELLVIPFYFWYVFEWLIRWIRYKDRNKAYYNICFEREAYQNEENPEYLKNRKFWDFIKYL